MGSGCEDAPRLSRGQRLSMLCWEINWFLEVMMTCSISDFTQDTVVTKYQYKH